MAFFLRFDLYDFTILPFDLYNAPSTFQRLMKHAFSYIIDQYVLVKLADILIYNETTESHD